MEEDAPFKLPSVPTEETETITANTGVVLEDTAREDEPPQIPDKSTVDMKVAEEVPLALPPVEVQEEYESTPFELSPFEAAALSNKVYQDDQDKMFLQESYFER
jgi:hypothetical protein